MRWQYWLYIGGALASLSYSFFTSGALADVYLFKGVWMIALAYPLYLYMEVDSE